MGILIAYLLGVITAIFPKGIQRNNEKNKTGNKSGKPNPSTQPQRISAEIDLSPTEAQRYYSEHNNSNSLQKRIFWVNLATLFVLAMYTCETHKTNSLTKQSLEFTRNSVEAQMVFGEWDVGHRVYSGDQITVRIPVVNIGHVPAVYGFDGRAFRWTDMPKGDIPFAAPDPNTLVEPSVPASIPMAAIIVDSSLPLPSDDFLYEIPRFPKDMTQNPVTRSQGPPFKYPSLFFVARVVYESLGRRTEKQMCKFMVRTDKPAVVDSALTVAKTDGEFGFYDCPKWNTTKDIK